MKITLKPGVLCYSGLPPKILLIMKLVVVILFTCLMQVSASSLAQRITLSEKNSSLEQVLRKVKSQIGYEILFASDVLDQAKNVTINLSNVTLTEGLDRIFEDQSLTYEIRDNTIIVKRKTPSFLDRVLDRFAAIDVRGVVVDGESGLGLAGASVKVKGTNRATTTGSNGEFYLRGVDEDAVIEISFVGFKSVELKAAKDMGTIKLEISFSDLKEVEINKGYYTEKRKLSTGSVARVTSSEIEKQPVGNPLAALIGRMSGVQIESTSGVPGANLTIQIRGQNSLRTATDNNGNAPLIIMDGVPYTAESMATTLTSRQILRGGSSFNNINPADIESVEVLKDGDATAIYGSRGSNGVILITTKKGKIGETDVVANVYNGRGSVPHFLELLSRRQYLDMRYEAFKNDGVIPSALDAQDLVRWDTTRNTDWQKELIGGTANTLDAQLAVSGGSVNTQFRLAGGYRRETTVFPGDFSDRKISGSTSLNHLSKNKKFTINMSTNYLVNMSNLLVQDLTTQALFLAPVAPAIYTADGTLNWEDGTWYNPIAYTKQPYSGKTTSLVMNSNLSYSLYDNIKVKSSFGYTNVNLDQKSIIPQSSFSPTSTETPSSRFSNNQVRTWLVEPQVTWKKNIGDGVLDLLIGSTFQETIREGQSFTGTGYANEALMGILQGATTISAPDGRYQQYRYNSLFGRIGYNHKDKYIVNITARKDGSTRFGSEKQFGNFGSLGLAWIFSEENFFRRFENVISFGKLRSSYGITGNDQIPNYGYLSLYNINSTSYQGVRGFQPSGLSNPDFSWESSRKIEIALELGFFKDAILFNTMYYNNRIGNQLLGYPLSLATGFSSVQANLPAIIQNTGFEFEVSSNNYHLQKINWRTSLNFSIPRSKLVQYNGIEGSAFANLYEVGKSLQTAKVIHYLGADPNTGLYRFEDVNNDGKISYPLDVKSNIVVQQRFSAGLLNSFTFGGVTVDVFLQYVNQLKTGYYPLTTIASIANQPIEVLDNWRKPGDIKKYPKFTVYDSNIYSGYNNSTNSDMNIMNGSFLRIKNIAVSYNFPSTFLKKMKIRKFNVFMTGQNVFTITKYLGLDPESGSYYLPSLRVFTAGVQLTL